MCLIDLQYLPPICTLYNFFILTRNSSSCRLLRTIQFSKNARSASIDNATVRSLSHIGFYGFGLTVPRGIARVLKYTPEYFASFKFRYRT